jgi:hypothetical protein
MSWLAKPYNRAGAENGFHLPSMLEALQHDDDADWIAETIAGIKPEPGQVRTVTRAVLDALRGHTTAKRLGFI